MNSNLHRLVQTWEWFCAIVAFDYDDPGPLSELVRTESEIPPEYKDPVSDCLAGRRKPNRKAAAKLKVPAAELMRVAGGLAFLSKTHDLLRQPKSVEQNADRRGIEPSEMRRHMQKLKRRDIQDAADHLGVSFETAQKMIRDINERIERWPVM